MASSLNRLAAYFMGTPPPPTEEEKQIMHRNRMREVGQKYRAEIAKLQELRTREMQAYNASLRESGGNRRSPAGVKAMEAQMHIRNLDAQIAKCTKNYRFIESSLSAVALKQLDKEFVSVAHEAFKSEKAASAGISAREVQEMVQMSNEISRETDYLDSALDGADVGEVAADAEMNAQFEADFQAAMASALEPAPVAAAVAAAGTEPSVPSYRAIDEAAETARLLRSVPTWNPPPQLDAVLRRY